MKAVNETSNVFPNFIPDKSCIQKVTIRNFICRKYLVATTCLQLVLFDPNLNPKPKWDIFTEKIIPEYGFSLIFSTILFFYEKARVKESPCSGLFFAVTKFIYQMEENSNYGSLLFVNDQLFIEFHDEASRFNKCSL